MSAIAKLRAAAASGEGDRGAPPDTELSAMDRRVRLRRITPALIGGLILVLAVVVAGAYAYMRYGRERVLSVAAERVRISVVSEAPFAEYVPVTGSIVPRDTAYLDITEGGQVTEVLVEEGTLVTAGQPLARLKNTRLELEVLGREAQLMEQQNNLGNARLAYEQSVLRNRRDSMSVQLEIARLRDELARLRTLEGTGTPVATIRDLERTLDYNEELKTVVEQAQAGEIELAERNIAQLELSVASMTQSLALVRDTLGDLTIVAPIDGQLTAFDINLGEVVGAGQAIGQIDTVGSFKVSALVDEFYLGRISPGQPASVEISGETYPLEVAKVYPNVRDRQFQVDLEFAAAAPAELRRGQTVRPRVELGETAETLVIDNGPYYEDTGGIWVFALSPDAATAERRDVTLGRRNPEHIEILAGLAEGDRVITSSYETFRDVQRIEFD